MDAVLSYLLMFGTAFGAATILPFYSEVVLLGLLATDLNPGILWLVASVGNTLGAVVNWFIGLKYGALAGSRWLPATEDQMARAQAWFSRWGVWTLLLAWAPVGGDALTFLGGIMRVRLWLFLLLVGAGKAARYAAIILAFEAV
ncbi:MAG: YqaA family protein [Pseudomonadota bacterium]